MQRAAAAGAAALGDAAELVATFAHARLGGGGGGFRGRSSHEDLYYTVFGLGLLVALARPAPPKAAEYLASLGDGDGLDFVHLTCLARCLASLRELAVPSSTGGEQTRPPTATPDARPRLGFTGQARHPTLLSRLDAFRAADGGFAPEAGAARGTAYACFLAVGAYEDLGSAVPDMPALLDSLAALRSADGGYANESGQEVGITPITAGIVALLRLYGRSVEPAMYDWLLARRHEAGGFTAVAGLPLPDLLSTATALHALAGSPTAMDAVRRPCLEFLDTVWDEQAGGFRGHAMDDAPDCEYTWYGLLALGCLKAMP
jgi:hypothetical protein